MKPCISSLGRQSPVAVDGKCDYCGEVINTDINKRFLETKVVAFQHRNADDNTVHPAPTMHVGETILGIEASLLADPINHPTHYTRGGIETIDVIEAWGLGFHLGNAVKYISRAGHKGDALEDLKKARWYLDREITRRKGTKP